MPKHQTSPRSVKERTGIDRLYKRVGKRKVSFYYQHPDGTSETLATATLGDRQAINEAERSAKRKALDIQQGVIVAGSVADLIDRFRTDEDPIHYLDQSKEGVAVRRGVYENLIKFFGPMHPKSLKTIHGYQYVEARAKAGAPKKAWKEIYAFSTICKKAIRWGVMEHNPFKDMDQDEHDKDVRTVTRSQVVRFYLWCQRQDSRTARMMGCLALFIYLTGYRTAEARPILKTAVSEEGVSVIGKKRKKGEAPVLKLREWTPRLRLVVARIEQARSYMTRMPVDVVQTLAQITVKIAAGMPAKAAAKDAGMKESTYYYWLKRAKKDERVKPADSDYLFPAKGGSCYTKSGLGSTWQDVMLDYIRSIDTKVTEKTLVDHPEYFSSLDVRPTAITKKLEKRDTDVYDFAGHANPATTHRHYDRRKIRKAKATE